MAIKIGLTGGIASGKSTVATMLKKRGYTIIDADVVAREVVEVGESAYDQIVDHFGTEILQQDKTIDRKKLGSIIFHNDKERMVLNSIVHPAVRKRMNERKNAAITSGKKTIIMDIPLLFESKLTHLVDKTIVVFVNEDIQLQRLMKRDNLSRKDAQARLNAQIPLIKKKQMADAVIDNSGSLNETERQLEQIIDEWKLSP